MVGLTAWFLVGFSTWHVHQQAAARVEARVTATASAMAAARAAGVGVGDSGSNSWSEGVGYSNGCGLVGSEGIGAGS